MCWQCWIGTTALWVSRAVSIGLRMLTSQLAALPIELGGPSKNVLTIQNIQEFLNEYYLVPHEFFNIRSRPFHLDQILSLIRPQEQCWNTCCIFICTPRQDLKQRHFVYCHWSNGIAFRNYLDYQGTFHQELTRTDGRTISLPTRGQYSFPHRATYNQFSHHRATYTLIEINIEI